MQTHPAEPFNWVPMHPSAMESFWVLAQRFMIHNVLAPYEFCRHFERSDLRHKSRVTRQIYQRLDLARLAPYLGHRGDTIQAALPTSWELGIRESGLKPVKICNLCAERGFHAALFETGWLDVCPIHNRPLSNRCPTCNKLLSHISWKRFGRAPGALACGHAWSDVSIRNAPDIDAEALRRLGKWVSRFKGRASEERWYAVSLHGVNALRQDNQDFRELVDCIAAIASLGSATGLRNDFWVRRFRPVRPIVTSRRNLRGDWLDAALHRTSRYLGGLVELPWQDQIGHIRRPYETHRWLRSIGQQRLVAFIQPRLQLLPLGGRHLRKLTLDEAVLHTIACALVHKHLMSECHPRVEAESETDQVERMCRFTGAPLGCMRVSRRNVAVYWVPAVLTPNHLMNSDKAC